MANLRVNKITGTEVFETTGSVQFDGSGDYLSVQGSGNDYNFGTNDFTVEFWVYVSATKNYHLLVDFRKDASTDVAPMLYLVNEVPTFYTVGGDRITGSSKLSISTWHHIALVRNSGTSKLYVNGIQSGSTYTDNNNYVEKSGRPIIGAEGVSLGNNSTNGHISNLRVLKGTALYTKNFTPPTRELTVIPNTVLLCCQSTTRANEEKTGKTITVNGNAVANELTPGLLTDRIKSGGSSAISGSVEFGGTTSHMTITESNDFDFGSGDFTIEYWYWESNSSKTERRTLDMRDSNRAWMVGHTNDNSGQIFFEANNSSGTGAQVFSSASANTTADRGNWRHLAVVRNGNTVTIFLDGINRGSSSFTLDIRSDQNTLTIGKDTATSGREYQGFLSNLRIIKGTALYTQNFIPPTRELKKLPGTVLLCCQDSTNPLQEATGKTISLNGSVTSYSVGIGTTTPNPRNFTPSVGFDGTVIFDGVTKINSPNYFYLPTGTTEDRGRGRGVFGGGETPNTNTIDYVNIQSTGNAIDFGDLISSTTTHMTAGCSSSTRGLFGGGRTPTLINNIDYITIATTSNALDFGDLLTPTLFAAGLSNSTRGIFAGGQTPTATNTIQYVTIASIGNAIDFGDLTISNASPSGCSSSTRGIIGGGAVPGGARTNTIDYVTISSTGNAQDFGDLTQARSNTGCSSSATRGVFGGGYVVPTRTNIIDYITISSTGNAISFGNLTRTNDELSSCSNSNRAVFAGGGPSTRTNTIDYVTIASTGNAQDFGDLTVARSGTGGCSDSHGGLG